MHCYNRIEWWFPIGLYCIKRLPKYLLRRLLQVLSSFIPRKITLESLRFTSISAAAQRLLSLFKQIIHTFSWIFMQLTWCTSPSDLCKHLGSPVTFWPGWERKVRWGRVHFEYVGVCFRRRIFYMIQDLWSAILTVIWDSERKAYCSVWIKEKSDGLILL